MIGEVRGTQTERGHLSFKSSLLLPFSDDAPWKSWLQRTGFWQENESSVATAPLSVLQRKSLPSVFYTFFGLCTWGGGGGPRGGGRYLYSRRVSNISGRQRPVSSPSYLAVSPKLVESWVALLGFNLYSGSIAVLLIFIHLHCEIYWAWLRASTLF